MEQQFEIMEEIRRLALRGQAIGADQHLTESFDIIARMTGMMLHSNVARRALKEPANDDALALSPRELEILKAISEGAPNKVIARKFDLAEATVKVHVKTILRKLKLQNRTQAAVFAASLFSGIGFP